MSNVQSMTSFPALLWPPVQTHKVIIRYGIAQEEEIVVPVVTVGIREKHQLVAIDHTTPTAIPINSRVIRVKYASR